MLTDAELRSELRVALEAVTPPAPWLVDSIEKAWRATQPPGRAPRMAIGIRISLRAVAAALLIALAASVAAAFLVLHHSPIPATPISGPVIFPTQMVTSTTGWAVTEKGTSQQWWRTVDGGSTWTDVTPPDFGGSPGQRYSGYFLDGSRGWITEAGGLGTTSAYVVTYRTLDGGRSWQKGMPVQAQASIVSTTVDFIDSNTGWMVISADLPEPPQFLYMYATTDGGMHWSRVASQIDPLISAPGVLVGSAQPSFLSATTGWLTVGLYTPRGNDNTFFFSRTSVLVTDDGGHTWRHQALPTEPAEGDSVDAPVFFAQSRGIMVMHPIDPSTNLKSVLFATSDGGRTWIAHALPGVYIWSAQFVDAQHGWVVAGPGADFMKTNGSETIPLPLYRTSDGGITWTRVATNLNLQSGRDRLSDVHFVDQTTGFATVWNDTGPVELLKSVDAGRTWNLAARCDSALGLSYPPPVCPASH